MLKKASQLEGTARQCRGEVLSLKLENENDSNSCSEMLTLNIHIINNSQAP
jgi:hypothetical protein